MISPLIAVQFIMRDTLGPAAFATAWADFMAGYREHFRAGGLVAGNAFALLELSRLGEHLLAQQHPFHLSTLNGNGKA